MNVMEVTGSLLKVIVVGLVLGAGLPAVFAVGLRSISRTVEVPDDLGGTMTRSSRPGLILGYACFLLVALAVVAGIVWIIVN